MEQGLLKSESATGAASYAHAWLSPTDLAPLGEWWT